jgi:hypothetical protein
MNPHKIRAIVEYIRRQGGLPTDEFGSIMAIDDVMVWFDLKQMLDGDEQRQMKAEIRLMAEAQVLADQFRLRS